MFQGTRPWFMSGLLLVAVLSACTKQAPKEDLSDRIARQTQRDLELSRIRLNPADCPGGGDANVYVALGDVVFRVPHVKDQPVARNPVYAGADTLPTPPMPDAPEGCKQHPARAQALHPWFLAAQSPDHVAASLTAISVLHNEGRARMQEVNEHSFDQAHAHGKCTNSPSGLTICGQRREDLPVATGVQVAAGNVAGGPRWVAVCGLTTIPVDDCTVHYLLREGIAVRYEFNQQKISLERMFELDPQIRDWLNSLVVEDYPWP